MVIFLNVSLPILFNIRLYIYTVRYKLSIIIPSFLRNISKKSKNFKTFKLISFSQKKKNNFVFMHTAES